MRARPVALALALVAAAVASPLAAQRADTARAAPGAPFFTRRDALLAGGFLIGTAALATADRRLARTFQDPGLQESATVRRGAAVFEFMGDPGPVLIGAGLYGVGRLAGVRPVAALGLHGLEAIVLSASLTGAIKGLAGRARPYVHGDTVPGSFAFLRGVRGRDYASFPSGHTSTAFAVAASTTAEVAHWVDEKGWWPGWKYVVGGTLYGGATLVGISRMYHDQHWASDVVAGAAIGTFSGIKVVSYAYRHPTNKIDRWLLPMTVAPDAQGNVAVVWTLPGP